MTKDGVLKILGELENALDKLVSIRKNYSMEKFSRDQEIQDIAKWNFYVLSQSCLDLGNHIVAEQSLGTPETYEDILEILEQTKKILPTTAKSLQGLAGFRNRLAHGYFRLDPEVLYRYLKNLANIETYLKEIKDSLKI